MNYLDISEPWIEWQEDLINEDKKFCFINGESDGRDGLKPQEPDDPIYMMGWEKGILSYKPLILNKYSNYDEF